MNELDILTDTLNEVLERAEAALAQHKVAVEIDLEDGRRLGFRKVGTSAWNLVWYSNDGVLPGYVKVLSSSRESRLIAAEHIPQLHEALLVKKSGIATRMRAAVESLEKFVEGLEEAASE